MLSVCGYIYLIANSLYFSQERLEKVSNTPTRDLVKCRCSAKTNILHSWKCMYVLLSVCVCVFDSEIFIF